MKTITEYRPLVFSLIDARRIARVRRAAALKAACRFVLEGVVRPVIGFAVGVVIALYLFSLLIR